MLGRCWRCVQPLRYRTTSSSSLRTDYLPFSPPFLLSQFPAGILLRNPSIHDGQHQRWNVSVFWSLVIDLVEARGGASSILLFDLFNSSIPILAFY
jgi:hypothetical protein